jgi:hypothetical protein
VRASGSVSQVGKVPRQIRAVTANRRNLSPTFGFHSREEGLVKRILKPLSYILAAIYFLVDAVFLAIARPISRWIARRFELKGLRAWIRSLPPYPSLALFSVPVIILEPMKPIAAYLAATGQVVSAAAAFITCELLKLVLVERLFSLTRDKLMRIPAFAVVYTKYLQARAWLEATEAWRAVRALSLAARGYVARLRAALTGHFGRLAAEKE